MKITIINKTQFILQCLTPNSVVIQDIPLPILMNNAKNMKIKIERNHYFVFKLKDHQLYKKIKAIQGNQTVDTNIHILFSTVDKWLQFYNTQEFIIEEHDATKEYNIVIWQQRQITQLFFKLFLLHNNINEIEEIIQATTQLPNNHHLSTTIYNPC